MLATQLAITDQQDSKVTATTYGGDADTINYIYGRKITSRDNAPASGSWQLISTVTGNSIEEDIELDSGVYDFYCKGYNDPEYSVSPPLRIAVTSGVGTKLNAIIDAMVDEINAENIVDYYNQPALVSKEWPPKFENIQKAEIKIIPESSYPVEGVSEIDDLNYGITIVICDRIQSAEQLQHHLWMRRKIQRLFSGKKMPVIPYAYCAQIGESVIYEPGEIGEGIYVSPIMTQWVSREERSEVEAGPNETYTYYMLVDSEGNYLTSDNLAWLISQPLT